MRRYILRQVFIIKKGKVIYQRTFGNAITKGELKHLLFKINQYLINKLGKTIGYYDYFNYRIAYDIEVELDLIFILITELMDEFFKLTQTELINLRNRFSDLFKDELNKINPDYEKLEKLNSFLDTIHKNLKPKIAFVGFSGVGKTTIKNLINQEEIPLQHIPTISGDITAFKMANIEFKLFDFAGQDQFKFLWKGFIKGSNAVLIITDSTPENVEKSRYFLKLINEETPHARLAVIGNKQDLNSAMKIDDIERIFGVKAYQMIANRPENKDKMIQIIGDVLDIKLDTAPIPEKAIKRKRFKVKKVKFFEKISK